MAWQVEATSEDRVEVTHNNASPTQFRALARLTPTGARHFAWPQPNPRQETQP